MNFRKFPRCILETGDELIIRLSSSLLDEVAPT